ncbi:MAG TPA: VOC family protein [Roseiflexaceae bacterium]|nr:VOC family protein [Roseiflexaceae bacterium]
MSLAIDHLVILVRDLAAASADYAALGFTVTPGGTHTDGATHNALIALADGSYFELIAFLRDAPEHRWWRHNPVGEGLIDFALVPDNIEAVIGGARGRGLDLEGPLDGGRLRPDGQRVAWRTGWSSSTDLPFLCADVTPRELRVPPGPARQHTNGAAGIAELTIVVRDLTASATRYQALLGYPPLALDAGRRATFALGETRLTLAAPGDDPALQAILEQRGEGPCALACVGGPSQVLDTALAHGVPIRIGA